MRNSAMRMLQGLRAGGLLREAASAGSLAAAFGSSSSSQGLRCLSVLAGSALQMNSSKLQAVKLAPALSMALGEALGRALHVSGGAGAQALCEAAAGVDGDAEGVLRHLDALVSAEGATAAQVADAAVALAYLQAKGNRRVWGKVVEKAGALKATFDAASLTSLLWALTTAGVEHQRTVAELAGTAAALLPKLSPVQVSVVVEALGRAGVQDAELYAKVASLVSAKAADYKPADLARILYGFASAGVSDGALAKAAGAGLAAKAAEVGAREAAQGLWALASMRRADKAVVDALAKALKSKLSGAESAADAAAGAWALGHLGVKEAGMGKALGEAIKAGVSDLSPAQAVQAALGLGQMSGADTATISALFVHAAAAIDKAPTALGVDVLAQLHAAAALSPDAKLPAAVASYTEKAFGLSMDAARHSRSGYARCFYEEVADAVALAMGARYRPEVAAAKAAFARPAADGSLVEIVVDGDAATKLAIMPVEVSQLTATSPATPLGSVSALAAVRARQGFKPVLISAASWPAGGDAKAKAGAVLSAVKAAVPTMGAKIDALSKKLAEPFDAYAQ